MSTISNYYSHILEAVNKASTFQVAVLVFVLSFVLYGSTLQNDYSLDDDFVVNEKTTNGFSTWKEIFSSNYISDDLIGKNHDFRPVVLLSFSVENMLFGKRACLSHLINIVLYALCSFLLYLVLIYLFEPKEKLLALVATIIFIFHPIHSEVVNNIKCRDELLAFFFGFSAFLLWLKAFDKKQLSSFLLGLLCFILAAFSKKAAFPLVLIIPFSIWFWKPNLKKYALFSFATIFSLVGVFKLYTRQVFGKEIRPSYFVENPLYDVANWLDRIPTGIVGLVEYIKLLVLPYPLRFYYGFNQVELASWTSLEFYLVLVIYSTILLFAIVLFNKPKWRSLSYGLFIYLIGVAAYSNIIIPLPGIIAERFVFLASVGFCIALASVFVNLIALFHNQEPKPRWEFKGLLSLFILLLFAYSLIIWTRNSAWENKMTLFETDIPNLEQSAVAHFLYSNELAFKARKDNSKAMFARAEKQLDQAIAIYPELHIFWNNLGYAQNSQSKFTEARESLIKAVELKGDFAESRFNLSIAEKGLNNDLESRDQLKKIFGLKASPNLLKTAYVTLEPDLPKDKSLQILEQGLSNNPDHLWIYDRLVKLYYSLGEKGKAINTLNRGLVLFPENKVMKQMLNGIKSEN